MQPPDSNNPIIEIEDYRYVSSEERPELDLEEEPAPPPAEPYIWVRESRGGGGCCCGGSTLLLLTAIILLLGLCWLIVSLFNWALPF